jgi:hypothetical protein
MSFVLDLLVRAWSVFLSSLGTTGLGFFVSNIVLFIVTVVITHAVMFAKKGKAALAQEFENFRVSGLVYALVLALVFIPIFGYGLFVKIPRYIRDEANAQPSSPRLTRLRPTPPPEAFLKGGRHESLPSFVFACCAIVVNNNAWDFILKHRGDKAVESIDVLFNDVYRLQSIRKNTPQKTVVNPSEWSVFLHIDKMYPKGLGSLFAKQFIWKPDSLDHGQYSLDISASTGRFHEDLFVEKANGKYTNAARVEEIDTKRTLFVCRDRDFPKSLAPAMVAENNCFPDWITQ